MFHITKIVNAASLIELVDTLNANTKDGYIEDQTGIGSERWVVRIACSMRSDAAFIRGFKASLAIEDVGDLMREE